MNNDDFVEVVQAITTVILVICVLFAANLIGWILLVH